MDILDSTIDEVALEGLDGITIPSLWIRLENRRPPLQFTLDDKGKRFIWKLLGQSEDIQFFKLKKPRSDIKYKIFGEDDDETLERQVDDEDNIYSFKLIRDGDVVGSCEEYQIRQDITKAAGKIPLEKALKTYGRNLVIVASQTCRYNVLFGKTMRHDLDINDKMYCFLELIGRGRWNGVDTGYLGKVMKVDSKYTFYVKKLLITYGLINSQVWHDSQKRTMVSILQLSRFHSLMMSKFQRIAENMSDYLLRKKNKRDSMSNVMNELDISYRDMKNFFRNNDFSQFFNKKSISVIKYKDSELTDIELNASTPNREIRIIELKRPFTVEELLEKQAEKNKNNEEDNETIEEKPLIMRQTLLQQMFDHVDSKETEGVSTSDFICFGFSKLECRSLCSSLHQTGLVDCVKIEVGRQKKGRYISKRHSKQGSKVSELREEMEKIYFYYKDKQANNPAIANMKEENDCLVGNFLKNRNDPKKPRYNKLTALNDSTTKTIRRASIVLDAIKNDKLVDELAIIQTIRKTEKEAGLSGTMDKKSFQRLLNKLEDSGYLKKINIHTNDEKSKEVKLVCHYTVQEQDEIVQNFTCMLEKTNLSPIKKEDRKDKSFFNVDMIVGDDSSRSFEPKFSPNAHVLYGYKPKMLRYKLFHEFLWYLTRYNGKKADNEPAWRDFIPKLTVKKYAGDKSNEGWCLSGEVLTLIPLSLLCNIYQIRYEIDDLEMNLRDSNTMFTPLKDLPSELKNKLCYKKRYKQSFKQILYDLCHLGLISLGNRQQYHEAERTFIYVHKKLKIIDTRDENRREHLFTLNTYDDWVDYWKFLETVCLETKPQKHLNNAGAGQSKKIKVASYNLKNSEKGKSDNEIIDVGNIPGDGSGAGGFDSLLYTHMTRNWYPPDCVKESKKRKPIQVKTPAPIATKRVSSSLSTLKRRKYPRIQNSVVSAIQAKARKTLKKVIKPDRRLRTDETDRKVKMLLKMRDVLRIRWSKEEDEILLMCKVANNLLMKSWVFSIPKQAVRDALHKYSPISKNKTSDACLKRIHHMGRTGTTTHKKIALYVNEFRMNRNLVKEYCSLETSASVSFQFINSAFSSLIEFLIEKFRPNEYLTNGCPINYQLKTLKDLKKNFEIDRNYTNESVVENHSLNTKEDAHYHVLRSYIHSALVAGDKKKRDTELYKAFKQYSDPLLRKVINDMKEDGMIIRAKKARTISSSCTLFTYSSIGQFHVAQRYDYVFFSKYDVDLCTKIVALINQLKRDKQLNFNETNEASSALCTSLMANDNSHLEVSLKNREKERAYRKRKANYVSWSVRLAIEDERIEETNTNDIAQYNYNKKLRIHKDTVAEVLSLMPRVNLTPPNVEEASLDRLSRNIYKIILEKDWIGADKDELNAHLRKSSPKDIQKRVNALIKLNYVAQAGRYKITYVATKCMRPWLLNASELLGEKEDSPPVKTTEEEMKDNDNSIDMKPIITDEEVVSKRYRQVQFAPRPWMTPEASLNKVSLKRMLFSVLSRITCNPGATKKKIYNYFQKKLCPVEVSELLDILRIIGAIKFKYLQIQERPTLFSKRRKISINESIILNENNDEVYLTVNPLAFIKVSQFFDELG
ncbi:DgyrCDS6580 [Dimorphilus gyrociliatus]|uniref:DgyrCDS6580 n=1 Tax=Dimorphilus gyrociliatus TaxID=2664684 RepID=A0A7I8VT93_9ANNE|nr:DgyrCDS6580 [Dimorphilus gyrociliatus]